MSDTQATLLLTRPAEDSARFLAVCEAELGRRLPVVMSPLIEIVDVSSLPDVENYATLIVTSRHAVDRLGQAGLLRGRRVTCVGEATAVAARGFGADAKTLGQDVQEFLTNSAALEAPCLYCRGEHVTADLAAILSEQGCPTEEAIVYEQVTRPLNAAARMLLSSHGSVVAPIFSKRSAALLQSAQAIAAPLKVIAISEAVAQSWSAGGSVRVAREPNNAAMVEATIGEF